MDISLSKYNEFSNRYTIMEKQQNDYFSEIRNSDSIGQFPNLEKQYGKKKAQQMKNDMLNFPGLFGKSNKSKIKSFRIPIK